MEEEEEEMKEGGSHGMMDMSDCLIYPEHPWSSDRYLPSVTSATVLT